MKINLVVVGHLKEGPELDLIDKYKKRFQWKLTIKEVSVKKNIKGEELKAAEADLIKAALLPNTPLLVLDERGKNLTSPQLATEIQKLQVQGRSDLNICIGGAEGLDQRIRDKATLVLSFGRLTWPHMLVRAMIVEQLYRAQQILAGHPYHKD